MGRKTETVRFKGGEKHGSNGAFNLSGSVILVGLQILVTVVSLMSLKQ